MVGIKKARRQKAKAMGGYKNRALTPAVKKSAEPLSPFVMSTQGTQAKEEPEPRRPWWENKPSGEGIK